MVLRFELSLLLIHLCLKKIILLSDLSSLPNEHYQRGESNGATCESNSAGREENAPQQGFCGGVAPRVALRPLGSLYEKILKNRKQTMLLSNQCLDIGQSPDSFINSN